MQFEESIDHYFSSLENVLKQLDEEMYKQPLQFLSGATIGQHVRHILELFEELCRGYEKNTVNYDNRKRDIQLETNRRAAFEHIAMILFSINKPDKPLMLSVNYSLNYEKASDLHTTYYRELVYNLEHMVHHMAMIRIALSTFPQIQVPLDFGVAVSTQRHKESCAQ